MLDEKKCGNIKQAIEFIQEKLRTAFDLNREDVKNLLIQHRESKTLKIKEVESSDDSEE